MPEKAIVFDLGGVLVDYDREWVLKGYAKACRDGTDVEQLSELLDSLLISEGVHTVRDLYFSLKTLGYGRSYDDCVRTWNGGLRKRDWVHDYLVDLNGAADLYVLSDTNAEHWDTIRSGLVDEAMFRRVFLSYEQRMTKHESAAFSKVLEVLERPAAHCLFIDDTASHTDRARAAGYAVHHYETKEAMGEAVANHLG